MNQDLQGRPWASVALGSALGRAAAAFGPAIRSLGRRAAALGLLATFGSAAVAMPLFFSGRLDSPGNTALVGSDLGPAQFAATLDVANNVALHAFTITTAGHYDLVSAGVSVGGFDPYVTIFSGLGAGATFFASNFDNAFSVGGDFTLPLLLAAGDYTLAVGAFANLSFAENLGVGTLGDGFTGLGSPASLDDGPYEITIDVGAEPVSVPEPAVPALCLAALAAMGAARGRRRRGRSWSAAITAAALTLTAGPALAQRAAMVANIDDSLRSPYQEYQRNACNGNLCTVTFSTVPAGRRRVVEFVSCRTLTQGTTRQLVLLTTANQAQTWLPITAGNGDPGSFFSSVPTLMFYEAGDAPKVFTFTGGVTSTQGMAIDCTLSGREITVP